MPSQELFEDLQDDDNMSHECDEVCFFFLNGNFLFKNYVCWISHIWFTIKFFF